MPHHKQTLYLFFKFLPPSPAFVLTGSQYPPLLSLRILRTHLQQFPVATFTFSVASPPSSLLGYCSDLRPQLYRCRLLVPPPSSSLSLPSPSIAIISTACIILVIKASTTSPPSLPSCPHLPSLILTLSSPPSSTASHPRSPPSSLSSLPPLLLPPLHLPSSPP